MRPSSAATATSVRSSGIGAALVHCPGGWARAALTTSANTKTASAVLASRASRISVPPGPLSHLAASLVLFSVPVLVLYVLFQREFIEGLTAGALKH